MRFLQHRVSTEAGVKPGVGDDEGQTFGRRGPFPVAETTRVSRIVEVGLDDGQASPTRHRTSDRLCARHTGGPEPGLCFHDTGEEAESPRRLIDLDHDLRAVRQHQTGHRTDRRLMEPAAGDGRRQPDRGEHGRHLVGDLHRDQAPVDRGDDGCRGRIGAQRLGHGVADAPRLLRRACHGHVVHPGQYVGRSNLDGADG